MLGTKSSMQLNCGTGHGNWGSGYYSEILFTDFTCEIQIENVSGFASRGILFRGDGHKAQEYNGYGFYLAFTGAHPGEYLIGSYINGASNTLVYWTATEATNMGEGAINVLKVVGQGPNFDFYINDIYVDSVINTMYPSGFIGFTGAESAWVRFDDMSCSHEAELMPRWIEPEHGETLDIWLDDAGQPTDQPPVIVGSEPFVETDNTRYLNPSGETQVGTLDELDEFVEYRVYRNDLQIGTSTTESFTDQLPAYGEYEYRVTAFYNPEGETIPSVAAMTNWDAVTYSIVGQNTAVPAGGGIITYDVQLFSELGTSFPNVIYRTYVTVPPVQTVYGPTYQYNFTLEPFMSVMQPGLQVIPAFAPPGDYLFTGKLFYQGVPVLEQSFDFDKMGEGVGAWSREAGVKQNHPFISDTGKAGLPQEFYLGAAYPNPFNEMTTVTVALPQAADLTVAVFNSLGQQVAELADGSFQAGSHSFTFDGSALASGIYFVRATVPGELNAIQKIVLMK